MNFVVFIVATYLLVQASFSTPVTGPIENAEVVVKNNSITLESMKEEVLELNKANNIQFHGTKTKGVDAYKRLDNLMETYHNQVVEINKNYVAEHGAFTEEDEICRKTRGAGFSHSRHEGGKNVSEVIGDAAKIYVNVKIEIKANLLKNLKIVSVKNRLVIKKCTRPTENLEECLTRELDEVKQTIEQLKKETETVKETIEKNNEVSDVVVKKLKDIVTRVEDELKKEVNDYSECLNAHIPSSTSNVPSPTTEAVVTTVPVA